jgi:predicted nucleic acid-binding protein
MGRESYLLDSNVVINYLSKRFADNDMLFLDIIINSGPNISIITKIEILSFDSVPANSKILRSFINDSNVMNLTDVIVEKCITLRKVKKIKLPDAIIAATANVMNMTLLSCDKDFSSIDNVLIMNIL